VGPVRSDKNVHGSNVCPGSAGGTGKTQGEEAGIVTPYGDTDPDTPEHLLGMFGKAFDALGIDIVGTLGVSAGRKGEVVDNEEAMEEAFDLGVRLCEGLR
jgi:hypothetical protein